MKQQHAVIEKPQKEIESLEKRLAALEHVAKPSTLTAAAQTSDRLN